MWKKLWGVAAAFDRISVYISKEFLWKNGPCLLRVFHIIHRFFHKQNPENPWWQQAHPGFSGYFYTARQNCVKLDLVTITLVKKSAGQKKHALFSGRHLSVDGGHPPGNYPHQDPLRSAEFGRPPGSRRGSRALLL